MFDLPKEIDEKVKALCDKGNSLIEQSQFDNAITVFNEAWQLLPEGEPWDAHTWIHTFLGDAYFLSHRYSEARDSLLQALDSPDGEGNPIINLRLGQTYYELNEMELAGEHMVAAYEEGGGDIFADVDPKYYQFLAEILDLPPMPESFFKISNSRSYFKFNI